MNNIKLMHSNLWAEKYSSIPQPDNIVQATYVWIDGRQSIRAKTRTLNFRPESVQQLPLWATDGHSIFITDDNAEIYLEPVRIYNDPFRGGNNILVLCQTLYDDLRVTKSNNRHPCDRIMKMVADQQPWFSIEQKYTLLEGDNPKRPLGWPWGGGFPYGRDIVEAHYRACMYAGIKIGGENAESTLSQWEYQIGPCEDIAIGDDLWMSRFILHRVAEDFHVVVTFDPKLIPGNLNGSGANTKFSTKTMREKDGLAEIKAACKKLAKNHAKHIEKYGANNIRRLIETDKTSSSLDQFLYGIADRTVSVRIPCHVANNGYGYLEDRRPPSNVDPYVVCEQLIRTICLNESMNE